MPTDLRGKLTDEASLGRYLLAGAAIVTTRSIKTGERVTLKVGRKKEHRGLRHDQGPVYFRGLLGQDNEGDYAFLGTLTDRGAWITAYASLRSPRHHDAARWLAGKLAASRLKDVLRQCEVWHEGRCGRCGRRLTVPESIATGMGPECAGRDQ